MKYEDLDFMPYECIKKIYELKQIYNESKQLNWMKLFGKGHLMLARNKVKGNSIIPFNTNIFSGIYYKTNFIGLTRNRNDSDFIII